MTLSQIAQTSQGSMVGDYISTSITAARATTVFAVGRPPTASAFDEAMYSPGRLALATPAQATLIPFTSNVATGPGIGDTIQELRQD